MTTPASPITPYLTVRKAEDALAFYQRAFQFEPGEVVPGPDGAVIHAGMNFRGTAILMFASEGMAPSDAPPMHAPASDKHPIPVNFYVLCDDVDAFTEHARANGATVLGEPEDMFWGDRIARFADPDGYLWTFATHTGKTFPMPSPA